MATRATPRPVASQLTCAATTMAIAAQTAAITMKVTPKSYRRMHVAPGEVRKHESSDQKPCGAAIAVPVRLGQCPASGWARAATSLPAKSVNVIFLVLAVILPDIAITVLGMLAHIDLAQNDAGDVALGLAQVGQ